MIVHENIVLQERGMSIHPNPLRKLGTHRLGWLRSIACWVFCLGSLGCSVPDPEPPGPKKLAIGSPAPVLQVQHWLTDGQGRLPKEVTFEPGRVYVVEFWATNCGPCIQTVPHLAALQKKYEKQGLQIIGITSEPPELVTPFLERKIQDPDGITTTIGDVAKAYHLGADPDGSVDSDYLLAARQNAIPVAFVVGKKGRVEWIGPPLELDPILAAILEDRWDPKTISK